MKAAYPVRVSHGMSHARKLVTHECGCGSTMHIYLATLFDEVKQTRVHKIVGILDEDGHRYMEEISVELWSDISSYTSEMLNDLILLHDLRGILDGGGL